MSNSLPTLLTTAQVADMLHTTPSTITRWHKAGRLKAAFKAPGLRGARLYREEDVEKQRARLARTAHEQLAHLSK
ncbi:MAG: helix-turn-helix domain-containing protein [Buchananella hordeovulneris]|nr:helix-turn-helix domain-containing protein [Buchananella hordeovulneris]